jgi:hypothetical protein
MVRQTNNRDQEGERSNAWALDNIIQYVASFT